MASTNEFRMSGMHWMREMIFRFAWIWLLIFSIAGVAGLLFGIAVDIRWLVCALMLICIVIPLVLVFFYYYYGLRREAYVNTLPHTVEATDNGLLLTLRLTDISAVENDTADGDNDAVTRDEFFAYADMKPLQIGLKSACVPLKAPAKGFIWIPASAFNDESELALFLETLDRNIRNCN